MRTIDGRANDAAKRVPLTKQDTTPRRRERHAAVQQGALKLLSQQRAPFKRSRLHGPCSVAVEYGRDTMPADSADEQRRVRAQEREEERERERTVRAERLEEQQRTEPLNTRQLKSLMFVRINTPLSLLFVVAAAMFGLMTTPDIERSFRSHPNYFTPAPRMFLVYMVTMFAFQMGFCTLAVISSNTHTLVRRSGGTDH